MRSVVCCDQREARGLSINDVEKRLRIRLQYIEAIEQGRFDLLPGAAYIPAFLRLRDECRT